MKQAFQKNIYRTIKKSLGRYMAIFAIIALGVGFFTGLKASKPAMMETGWEYIQNQNMYDYRLLSSWGFDEDEVAAIEALDRIETAEGAVWEDFIYVNEDGEQNSLKALSITDEINRLTVTAGRLPQQANECVVDAYRFPESMIGEKITVSSENSQDTRDSFAYDTYTVTGLVRSPLYMNMERGTTSIGNGKITAFVFIPLEGFSFDYYKEVYVCSDVSGAAFSEEYQTAIDKLAKEVDADVTTMMEARYKKKIADARAELSDMEKLELSDMEKPELSDMEKPELLDMEKPELYVLDRNTNVGYASFEGDVSIVEGVARIFPVFFFLIAALVCSTTMTRMVDDERTQIGTLRALGYTKSAILFKYMIYSGSAAGLGAAAGYYLGSRLFPMAIWTAYDMLYGFSDIIIVDNIGLLLISLLVALLCSVGTTFAACRLELSHAPAELIRPKALAAGKRIFLEKLPFLWKRLKFLHKVSARNVFRFKKRMIMMILGIAGCTALVIAGFGVKDSVSNIVNDQYDEILKYHISATYTKEMTEAVQQEIREQFGQEISGSAVLQEASAEAPYEKGSKTVTLMVSEGTEIKECVDFHLGKASVELPRKGEILIDNRLADVLSAKVGDEIRLKVGDKETKPLRVAGIFENYTFYYAYVTGETYEAYFGEAFEPKTIYVSLEEGADHYRMASYLSDMKNASNVIVVADMRTRVQNTMASMDYIVVLIICCAAALAFIVLFNLGNINISERVREIATLKVLGFYPRETGAYVFRENMVLSILGILVGIPLGTMLHHFVMLQIKIDMVSFEIRIRPVSYLYSVLAVLGFTICVDVIMRRKINRINMAESLKSIE